MKIFKNHNYSTGSQTRMGPAINSRDGKPIGWGSFPKNIMPGPLVIMIYSENLSNVLES